MGTSTASAAVHSSALANSVEIAAVDETGSTADTASTT